jgi:hypothetical protein
MQYFNILASVNNIQFFDLNFAPTQLYILRWWPIWAEIVWAKCQLTSTQIHSI